MLTPKPGAGELVINGGRAGGKWTYEEYLQKHLPIFLFLFDFSLLNVKISRVYNEKTR